MNECELNNQSHRQQVIETSLGVCVYIYAFVRSPPPHSLIREHISTIEFEWKSQSDIFYDLFDYFPIVAISGSISATSVLILSPAPTSSRWALVLAVDRSPINSKRISLIAQ